MPVVSPDAPVDDEDEPSVFFLLHPATTRTPVSAASPMREESLDGTTNQFHFDM
jgi:hypothetical protein